MVDSSAMQAIARPAVEPARRLPSRAGTDVGSIRGSVKGSIREGSVRGSVKAGSVRGSVKAGSVIGSAISGKGGTLRTETTSVVNLRKRESLRETLVKTLLDKYHPGIANSKTEQLIVSEVDKLIAIGTVSEHELRDAEAKIRKQSNLCVRQHLARAPCALHAPRLSTPIR